MSYYAFLINGKLKGAGQAKVLGDDVQSIEISKDIYEEIEADKDRLAYKDGEFVLNPEYEIKVLEKEVANLKAKRAEAVSQITVEVDGLVFDGDEVSQERMSRSIVALNDGEKITWVLHDNAIAEITKEQLKSALRLAGQKQTELWTMPYV